MAQEVSGSGLTTTRISCAVVVLIVVICVGLVLPALQAAREAARRMSCSNNFKQLGFGIHNYHAAYDIIPPISTGTGPTPGQDDWSNQRRLSSIVGMVPFVEASALWESIVNPYITGDMPAPPPDSDPRLKGGNREFYDSLTTADGPFLNDRGEKYFPVMGPAPWRAIVYPPWQAGLWSMRCPSDGTKRPLQHAALSNYAFCYGDAVQAVGEPRLFPASELVAEKPSKERQAKNDSDPEVQPSAPSDSRRGAFCEW